MRRANSRIKSEHETGQTQPRLLYVASSFTLLIVVLASCGGNAVSEKSVVLTGTVVDATDDHPLDSAWVVLGDTTLSGRSDSTDALGRFSVPSTPFLIEELTITRVGYASAVDTFQNVTTDVGGLQYRLKRE